MSYILFTRKPGKVQSMMQDPNYREVILKHQPHCFKWMFDKMILEKYKPDPLMIAVQEAMAKKKIEFNMPAEYYSRKLTKKDIEC